MLDSELSSSSSISRPGSHLRRRARELAEEHEALLVLLTTLRAASAQSLRTLYFERPPRYGSERDAYRQLARLVAHGLIAKQNAPSSRSLYRLASAGLSLSERVRARATDAMRKRVPDSEAGHCWLRSALWAELVERGYVVGRGQQELVALRRFLIDKQATRAAGKDAEATRVLAALRVEPTLTPLFRSHCARCEWASDVSRALRSCPRCAGSLAQSLSERRFECPRCGAVSDRDEAHESKRHGGQCTGAVREIDHLSFDVAWRASAKGREVLLVFVDDPAVSLDVQLRALPLRIVGQPRLSIVLRTTDPSSVFDRATGQWTAMGDRHRALVRAFSEDGARDAFPFSMTADVVDIKPELQLRLGQLRRKKDKSHA